MASSSDGWQSEDGWISESDDDFGSGGTTRDFDGSLNDLSSFTDRTESEAVVVDFVRVKANPVVFNGKLAQFRRDTKEDVGH